MSVVDRGSVILLLATLAFAGQAMANGASRKELEHNRKSSSAHLKDQKEKLKVAEAEKKELFDRVNGKHSGAPTRSDLQVVKDIADDDLREKLSQKSAEVERIRKEVNATQQHINTLDKSIQKEKAKERKPSSSDSEGHRNIIEYRIEVPAIEGRTPTENKA